MLGRCVQHGYTPPPLGPKRPPTSVPFYVLRGPPYLPGMDPGPFMLPQGPKGGKASYGPSHFYLEPELHQGQQPRLPRAGCGLWEAKWGPHDSPFLAIPVTPTTPFLRAPRGRDQPLNSHGSPDPPPWGLLGHVVGIPILPLEWPTCSI